MVCNCDDQKSGFIDDNVLKSMEQLPVTGSVYSKASILWNKQYAATEYTAHISILNVRKRCISVVHHGI